MLVPTVDSNGRADSIMLTGLPLEVIDHVCTFLDVRDICAVRLTRRSFTNVAPWKLFNRLVFYLHHDDFEMLRHFANHLVYAHYVTSLVYKTDVLEPRRLSLEEFVAQKREIDKKSGTVSHPPQENSVDSLREAFERYKHIHHQQSHILAEDLDFTILEEVVPKFPKLQCIIVSARDCPPEDGIPMKPFEDLLVYPGDYLKPYGSRHVSSLLRPLVGLRYIHLQKLRLGMIDWSFIEQEAPRMDQMIELCQTLTAFELHLDIGADPEGPRDNNGSQMVRYKAAVEKGGLRRLLGSMTELQVLRLGFTCADPQNRYPAALSDFLPEGVHWKYLRCFVFQGVEGARQDMVDFVRRHSSTVTSFYLHNFRLVRSSWLVFLPELRRLAKEMSLIDVWISGTLLGEVEGGSLPGLPVGETELFELGNLGEERDELSNYITYYIKWNTPENPWESHDERQSTKLAGSPFALYELDDRDFLQSWAIHKRFLWNR